MSCNLGGEKSLVISPASKMFPLNELSQFFCNRQLCNHCLRVANYAAFLARILGLMEDEETTIYLAGFFHDIGKIRVGETILCKPSSLTTLEREIVEKHPVCGALVLRGLGLKGPLLSLVLHHHEHFDGNGYPARLSGEGIPVGARILGVADAYDAMTSPRSYRRVLSPEEAIDELKRCKGTQFDPVVVEAFVDSHPYLTRHAGQRCLVG